MTQTPKKNPSTEKMSDNEKQKLRAKLQDKLYYKNMGRRSAKAREAEFERNFKNSGIDIERLKKDLELVNKQGGFQIKL